MSLQPRLDSTEKTIALGPLDLFPASMSEPGEPAAPVRPELALRVAVPKERLSPGVEKDEVAFVMGPSLTLRARRRIRFAADAVVGLPGRLSADAARAWLRALRRDAVPFAHRMLVELARTRGLPASVASDLRALPPAQRRTTLGAFLAGAVVASLAAWIV